MYSQFPPQQIPPNHYHLMRGGPLPPHLQGKGFPPPPPPPGFINKQPPQNQNQNQSQGQNSNQNSDQQQQQQQQRLPPPGIFPPGYMPGPPTGSNFMPPHFPSNNSNNNLLIIPMLDLVHHLHLWVCHYHHI